MKPPRLALIVPLALVAACGTASPAPDAALDASADAALDAASDGTSDAPRDVALDVADVADAARTTTDDAAADASSPRRYTAPSCPRDDEAPLSSAQAPRRCVAVGADLTRLAVDLPDPRMIDATLPTDVRYVRPGATGGDGTRERPFGTLAAAVSALPATGGTVAIAPGRLALPAAVVARGALAVVGAGASHTVIVPAAGGAVVSAGTGARLTVRGLSVEHDASDAAAGEVGDVTATGGATVTLRDVAFTRPQVAVLATGAGTRVVADGLTVRGARSHGVAFFDSARATLRDVLLRGGRGVGAVAATRGAGAEGARLAVIDGLVADNAGGGVRLAGRVGFLTGADCTAADVAASRDEFDCLTRVALQDNTGVAVAVSEVREVVALRLVVSGTRAGAGAAGDGVVASAGGRARFDDDLASMDPMTVLGRGTQVVANARAGMLGDGAGTVLRAHGALVASNGGPGMFLQRMAESPALGAVVFADNVGVGLGASTGARLEGVLCDQFLFTRAGTVRGATGDVTAGDGVSLYGARMDSFRDNELSDNARFGLLMSGVAPLTFPGVQLLRNAGARNGFGVGVYGDPPMVFDNPDRIQGRAPAPAADPGGASSPLP